MIDELACEKLKSIKQEKEQEILLKKEKKSKQRLSILQKGNTDLYADNMKLRSEIEDGKEKDKESHSEHSGNIEIL